jgi:hypothetical protein
VGLAIRQRGGRGKSIQEARAWAFGTEAALQVNSSSGDGIFVEESAAWTSERKDRRQDMTSFSKCWTASCRLLAPVHHRLQPRSVCFLQRRAKTSLSVIPPLFRVQPAYALPLLLSTRPNPSPVLPNIAMHSSVALLSAFSTTNLLIFSLSKSKVASNCCSFTGKGDEV